MNLFSVILFLVIFGVFGTLVYTTQQNSSKTVTIPTVAVQAISPTAQGKAMQATPSATQDMKASYSAVIQTTKGDISLTLFAKDAPNTVKNFVTKAKAGYYSNLTFHRVEDWVLQGGDPLGNGTGGGNMPTELNKLPFVKGALGVARGGDIRISNDSQFFITKSDASWLNGQYTNFGQVTDGMDVVMKMTVGDKILGITVK